MPRNQKLIDDAKERIQAICDAQERIQAICDAHTGQHLFEGGSGVSGWVSVVVRLNQRDVWVPYAAYGNGLQLGAAFSDAMKAAGFNEFDVVLD